MAKRPEDRFSSAQELARALEDFESSALQGPPPLLVNAALSTLLTLGSMAAAVLAVVAMVVLPRLFPMELSNVLVALASVGMLLSVTDGATRGRYMLWPLSLSVALATLCVAALLTCLEIALVSPTQPDAPFPETFAHVVGQAVSTLGLGAGACGAQLLLWGVARRRALVAS